MFLAKFTAKNRPGFNGLLDNCCRGYPFLCATTIGNQQRSFG